MLHTLENHVLDNFEILSEEMTESIAGGHGSGILTAVASGGVTGIVVALGNGACDTPSQCGQTASVLGSAIGGGSEVTAPTAQSL